MGANEALPSTRHSKILSHGLTTVSHETDRNFWKKNDAVCRIFTLQSHIPMQKRHVPALSRSARERPALEMQGVFSSVRLMFGSRGGHFRYRDTLSSRNGCSIRSSWWSDSVLHCDNVASNACLPGTNSTTLQTIESTSCTARVLLLLENAQFQRISSGGDRENTIGISIHSLGDSLYTRPN